MASARSLTQHLPSIAETPGFELVAIADPKTLADGIAHHETLEQLLDGGPAIDAIALCTPPQTRNALLAAALKAGKHMLLENPRKTCSPFSWESLTCV